MSGFKCPFCGQIMSISDKTRAIYELSFNHGSDEYIAHEPKLGIIIYRCPNDSCKKDTVVVKVKNGYIEEKTVRVFPESNAIKFPEYIPPAIRNDYEEASAIKDKSPKAAATLARRCLQGMIRDYWGIKKNNLSEAIKSIQDKVSPSQWRAIDAIRKVGNIGAHMENDVNLIIDVDPDEAEKLLKLIELLMEKWYIARYDEEKLYSEVSDIADEKSAARHT